MRSGPAIGPMGVLPTVPAVYAHQLGKLIRILCATIYIIRLYAPIAIRLSAHPPRLL